MQTQKPSVSIEELALKVDKLQHDYDYLWCEYKMKDLIADLGIKANAIQISANKLYDYSRDGVYSYALYKSYSDFLDSYRANLGSTKDLIDTIKTAVFIKIATCGFSDEEKDVLYNSFEAINQSVTAVEASIEYHEVALKAYRRW